MSPTAKSLVLVALLVAARCEAVDQQASKQILQQAEAAAASGKVDQAETMVCAAATKEQKNAELQAKCDTYRQQAQAQRDTDHKHLNKGAADFAMKNLDAAEHEFQAIQSTSYSNLKKEWLDKVTQARAQAEKEQQAKEQERKAAEEAAKQRAAQVGSSMQADLNRAIDAYEKNDFGKARKMLSVINGAYQEQAQKYIANIDQYNRAMSQGAKLEKAGDSGLALAAYQRAAAIKPNGPGGLKEKIAILQQAMAQSGSTQLNDTQGSSQSTPDVLRSAIEAYYQGDYSAAEQQLSLCKESSPKLDALAHFYLGASRLNQYFLASDEAQKKQLWSSALADLQIAKHAPEFVAPKTSVSPKVIEVYETAVQ